MATGGLQASALTHGGQSRSFLVHVPRGLGGRPLPVVLNFHGGGSNAQQQRRYCGMDATADRHGFVVVYPNGTGARPGQRMLLTFNAGRCCPPATRNDIDDVGFAAAIVSKLSDYIEVDSRRIYATGMSNGGMMAHRLAAQWPGVAAVASVAGQLNLASFAPTRPVSVLEFHSVDDGRALYQGGLGARFPGTRIRNEFPSVEAGIQAWARHNGCPAEPAVGPVITGQPGTVNEGQTATEIRYGPGRGGAEVVLCRLTGAGHVWPGARAALPRVLGQPTTLVDANEVMWQFFAAHPLM